MNVKVIPNLLTALRFVFTAFLLFVDFPGVAFAVLYLGCGLTDILDGRLARKFQAESVFGARLDSVADLCFIGVMLFRLWPFIIPNMMVLFWVLAIALLRFIAALVAKIRFGCFGFLHTRLNKITGLLLFLYPLILYFPIDNIRLLYFLCAAATASALEEFLLELKAKHWNPDCPGFWYQKRD